MVGIAGVAFREKRLQSLEIAYGASRMDYFDSFLARGRGAAL